MVQVFFCNGGGGRGAAGRHAFTDPVYPRRRAFTLIELLVVIAIISVLAAMLFPVFAKARDKARQAACASNLKQINLAVLQYVQDFDETWPISAPVHNGATQFFPQQAADTLASPSPVARSVYANAMHPYVKSWEVWACPSGQDYNTFNEPESTLGEVRFSYEYNGYLNAWPDNGIPSPAKTVSFLEMSHKARIRKWIYSFPYPSQNCPGGDPVPFQFQACLGGFIGVWNLHASQTMWVHGQGTNYAYADGHVKWVRNPGPDSAFRDTVDTGSISNWTRTPPYAPGVPHHWVATHAPVEK